MTTVAPARTPTTVVRVLGLVAVVAVEMLIADLVVSRVVVIALFGGVPAVLFGILLVAAVLAAVIALSAKALVGRPTVFGAIVVTLLLAGLGAYGFLSGILPPTTYLFPWLHLVLCVLCAVAVGLFTGPWPLRIVGVVAAIAAVVVVAVQPTTAQRAQAQQGSVDAAQIAANSQAWLDGGVFPVVTDLPGWRAEQVQPTGPAVSWLVEQSSRAVAVASTSAAPPGGVDAVTACPLLATMGETGTPGPDGLTPWCERTADGWARVDGTARVLTVGGLMVVLYAGQSSDVEQVGGTSVATPADLEKLAGSLHPMTRADAEAYLLDAFTTGAVVDLPAGAGD